MAFCSRFRRSSHLTAMERKAFPGLPRLRPRDKACQMGYPTQTAMARRHE